MEPLAVLSLEGGDAVLGDHLEQSNVGCGGAQLTVLQGGIGRADLHLGHAGVGIGVGAGGGGHSLALGIAVDGHITGLGGRVDGLLGHEGNAAVAVDIGIDAVSRDGGQIVVCSVGREGQSVVLQNLPVGHDIVEDVGCAVEHGEAVAEVAEGVVIAGKTIGLGSVERLAADGDVLDTVIAGRSTRPNTLVVLLNGGGDVGMDLVGDAGDLQEAATFADACVLGAPLKGIEDLLAGDFDQASDVAEGVDGLEGLAVELAGDGLVTDAAAVHDGSIDVQVVGYVEEVVQSIGSEVAGVRLLLADEAVAVGVVVVERDLGIGNDLAEDFLAGGHPVVLHLCDGGVGAGIIGDKLGGDGVTLDGHLADGGEVGAGLGEQDGVAALVGDLFAHDGGMRVAVDPCIKAGGVGNDFLARPGLGGDVVTAVAEGDDVIGVLGLGCIDGSLHGGVQRRAVLAAGDAVDVVAFLILEVLRGGLGEGLGGGNADDGDLLAADLEDLVGVEDVVALDAVCFVVEVGGEIREVRTLDELQCALHAVVELVVAQRCGVVTGCVHHFDDLAAVVLVGGAEVGALDVVTCVEQEGAGSDLGGLCLQVGNGVIGQRAVDVGMNVVGVEDDDLVVIGQLVAAARANAVDIVMAQSRDRFGLLLAADGAGVLLQAGLGAGRLGDHVTGSPSVGGAGNVGLKENGDDLGKLCTGGRFAGEELSAHAVDDALGDRPVEGIDCPAVDAAGIGVGVDAVGGLRLGLALVTPDHGDEPLTGEQTGRVKATAAHAVDDALVLGPCDSILVPIVGEVSEAGLLVDDGGACHAVQNRDGHCTGAGAVRLKLCGRGAVHQVMLINILDIRRIPFGILNVRKRADIGCACEREDADNHHDCQKQRNDSLGCVFHFVSSLNFQNIGLSPILGGTIVSVFPPMRKVGGVLFSVFTNRFFESLIFLFFS